MIAVLRPSAGTVRRLAFASLIANVGIVVTGGAVRLTSSGLGCPEWPRCTGDSYVPTREIAAHGAIEFGNRTLTFVLTAIVLATFIATVLQRPRRTSLVRLSLAVMLGIPAQAVLGGITVLTDLNPWTVAGHFGLSIVIIGFSLLLWHRSRELSDAAPEPVVRREGILLGRLLVAAAGLSIVLGTIVTGSGPHAGDKAAARTGFDPATVSQLHADSVMLLVGLSIATWLALRAMRAPALVIRAAGVLVLVELAQGAIGYTQYFTDLPIVLVGVHMLGACLVWIAALRVQLAMWARPDQSTLDDDRELVTAEKVSV